MKLKEKLKTAILSPTRLIVLGFGAVIFVGAFLLCLPFAHNDGNWFPFIDALFTATSSVCVTGLIVVDTAVQFNYFGQAIILILIQLGGIGVMTGATIIFVLIGRRISLKNRLLLGEALVENRLQGIVKMIKKLVIFTFLAELVGALILMCSFIPAYGAKGIFTSIFISISSFCNAGFDVLGVLEQPFSSLMAYAGNAFVCLPIMALIIIGGLGFTVINDVTKIKKKHHLTLQSKIVLISTLLLILIGWFFYALLEWDKALSDFNVGEKLVASLFQSVTPRTAGFNSIDQAALTPVSYILTLILMFIGASPASTGGGIKTTTFVMLFIIAYNTLQGNKDVNIGRAKLNDLALRKIITILVLAITLIMLNSLLILVIERNNSDITVNNVLFEVVSAFSTVGLSFGITPQLQAGSKLILGITMFAGRVGMLTLGASLAKIKKSSKNKIEYTDAKIMIG